LAREAPERNPRPVRAYGVSYAHGGRTFSSVDLRDFESILIFFSEEEIEELQGAIDKRRSLALDEESLHNLVKQSDHSANGVEDVSPEVPLQHPA
jgi:hypothetical protein